MTTKAVVCELEAVVLFIQYFHTSRRRDLSDLCFARFSSRRLCTDRSKGKCIILFYFILRRCKYQKSPAWSLLITNNNCINFKTHIPFDVHGSRVRLLRMQKLIHVFSLVIENKKEEIITQWYLKTFIAFKRS